MAIKIEMYQEKSFRNSKRNSLTNGEDDESSSFKKRNKRDVAKEMDGVDLGRVTTSVNESLTWSQKRNGCLRTEKIKNVIDIDDIVSKLKNLSEKKFEKIIVQDLVEESPESSYCYYENKSNEELNSRDLETEEENCSASEAFFQGKNDMENYKHANDKETLFHKAQKVKSIRDLEPDCICLLISNFLPSLIDIKEEKVVESDILF